ncbi:unnamed protein product [Arctia plantaginis]|uniref:Uncharacterized protein n=1 Tax=Arctia plantaginis TaxID=874455 RepID=A0A8S1BIS6_ARCPL|nr:unnamed protein product [Arctia plantaginis]
MDYLLGRSHQVCPGRKHFADSPEAEAERAPYATGRRPKAAAAVARATYIAEPFGKEPCTVFHHPRRLVPRGIATHPFIT